MATVTKNARTIQASASNTAGGSTTGTAVDLTTAFGAAVTGKVTNGATGPTVGCDFVIEVSHDNATWYESYRVTAGVANSGSYSWTSELGMGVMYARARFTGNTGQAVTVEAYLQEATSI